MTTLFRAIQLVSVLAGALLVILGSYYYFYATRQQEYLAARNLRTLATLSTQVEGTLETLDQVLENLEPAKAAAATSPILRPVSIHYFDATIRRSGGCAGRLAELGELKAPTRWSLADSGDGTCLLRSFADTSGQESIAVLDPQELLRELFAGPVGERVFDATILADTSGVVLVQAGPPELSVQLLNAIPGIAPVQPKATTSPGVPTGPTWAALRGNANRLTVTMAGHEYELFLQPCCHAGPVLQGRGLVVGALVRKSAFVRQSLQISYSIVAFLVALLLVTSTAAPFLKLKLVGPLQRIRPSDVLVLSLCTILSASLTTVVVLDLYAYGKLRRGLDGQLAQLGDSVATHLRRELRLLEGDLRTLARWNEPPPADTNRGDLLAAIDTALLRYPFFDAWARVDDRGKQQSKWVPDRVAPGMVTVAERQYFRSARSAKPNALAIESVQSWATGEHAAVLAIRTPDSRWPVATMTAALASVIDPIVAPQFVVAVVDTAGLVLFHSDKARNTQERIFAELDMSRAVRSAVFARTSASAMVKYGGEDYQAYVRPVADVPWSVIALRDRKPIRVTNLEAVGTTVLFVVFYAVLMILVGVLHIVSRREVRMSWIWPDRDRGEDYSRLVLCYVVMLFSFGLGAWHLAESALFSASTLLPFHAALLTWAVLTSVRAAPAGRAPSLRVAGWKIAICFLPLAGLGWVILGAPRRTVALMLVVLALQLLASLLAFVDLDAAGRLLRPRPARLVLPFRSWPATRRYLLGAWLFLMLVCVLPAFGLFQVAHRLHVESFVRHGQYRIAAALDARRMRAERRFSDSEGRGKGRLLPQRLCPLGATQEAIGCGLDLYHTSFYGTRVAGSDELMPETQRRLAAWAILLREPYEAENSVERRPMVLPASADGRWRSAVQGHTAWLRYRGARSADSITVTSQLPSLSPDGAREWFEVALMFGLLLGLTWGAARFVSRRLFLIDLIDVRSLADADPTERSRQNLLVLFGSVDATTRWVADTGAIELDLSLASEEWSKALVGWRFDVPIAITVRDAATESTAQTLARLNVVERLIFTRAACVHLLVVRTGLERPIIDRSDLFGRQLAAVHDQDRLARLMDAFTVVDVLRRAPAPVENWPNPVTGSATKRALRVLKDETSGDPILADLFLGIRTRLLRSGDVPVHSSKDETLDELGERAEAYYQQIWGSCSREERVVLVHVAEDHFANSKDRATVRRLLARGLLQRVPRLCLLNETFRRFVIRRGAEVEAEAERARELSVWDGVKWPILVLVVVGITFFFVTQQEFFNAATAVVMGLATGLPAFVRLVGWVADRRVPT